jgi:hypothetical protein
MEVRWISNMDRPLTDPRVSAADKPATAISFVAGSDALVITGDYGSFSSSFATTQLVVRIGSANRMYTD